MNSISIAQDLYNLFQLVPGRFGQKLILPLPFPEEMLAAMLEHRGRIGRLLKFAQIIESADETGIDFMQTNMRLPAAQVYDAYNEAYDWMTRVASMSTDVQPAAKGGTA